MLNPIFFSSLEFPYQAGKAQLKPVEGLSVAFCDYIDLDRTNFNEVPHDQVKVLLTVSWNANQTEGMPHEATAAWTEDVSKSVDFHFRCLISLTWFLEPVAHP